MQPINHVPHASRYLQAWHSLLFALLLLSAVLAPLAAQAQAWSLTAAQREAYVKHYAPLIMQRAEEDSTKPGRDWISNYDFDRDANFSNNRQVWANVLSSYVSAGASGSGAYQHWRIRPTLYSSVVEYMDGGSKGLVLFFHVFHPVDKKANQIHDWERIEIVVRGVTGTPGGSGEYVGHVTITSHHDHVMRRVGSSDLNFMQVSGGKHVMIWQADEDNTELGTHGHELHFVQDSYATISSRVSANGSAKVDVTNDDPKSVHYVWVPETSSAAVTQWNAKAMNYSNATTLAARRDDTVSWSSTKRITYELQDLSDVFLTHWSGSTWWTNWTSDDVKDFLLASPVVNEAGQAEVPAGLQRFYLGSRDSYSSSLTDGRDGILSKNWFLGAYSAETNADTISGSDDFGGFSGAGRDSYGRNRADASGDYSSLGNYWRQHDLFVHSGTIDTRERYEAGIWLLAGWHLPENGGFDGRWAQLFDDRPSYEAAPEPTPPPPSCPVDAQQQCEIDGGVWNSSTCSCKIFVCSTCQIQ
ncbi:MAG: hypothetical protein M3Q11_06285 [Pseudomonadota bacterium]|nr:hypothetical protein [Pseudomonadota bacterium]